MTEADHCPGLERAFAASPEESSYPVRQVGGQIPPWLRGTCYWNGPARFARGGQRYDHWLDGDGMVSALRFEGAGAHFTNRFVRSAKWQAEEAAGRALFRTFGTRFADDRLAPRGLALESPVNVSVIPFAAGTAGTAGTAAAGAEPGAARAILLACGEQGMPWELDPVTLETRGPFTFGGALNPISPFAAHAKIDAATGELWNFGLSYAHQQPAAHLYRFSPTGTLIARRRVPLDLPVSMHDFLLAPHHVAFHVSPYRLDVAALAGGATLHESLRWEPAAGASEILLVRRADLDRPGAPQAPIQRLALDGGYCLHAVAAGEDAAGHLVLDFIELDRPVYDDYVDVPNLLCHIGPGRPVRLIIDTGRSVILERRTLPYELAPDFPVVAPAASGAGGSPAPEFWTLGLSAAGRRGRKFYDQLVHCHWQSETVTVWQAPPCHYLAGEAAFAPHPDPAAGGTPGLLACPLFDATQGRTHILLFDAADITTGPVADLTLESALPPVFHGAFAPEP